MFSEGFEIEYSPETERAQRSAAAARGGAASSCELVVCSTNVRELFWGVVGWSDGHGAALAMLGQSLSGGLRSFAIASNTTYANVMPRGSNPQTDPLWSSERVEIAHDSAAFGRTGKVVWLARERPELLDHLYVCWGKDSTRNCGRCDKCLMTMIGLAVAGALETCTRLPVGAGPGCDRPPAPPLAAGADELEHHLEQRARSEPEWEPLREAIGTVIRESAAQAAAGAPSAFGLVRHTEATVRGLLAGVPTPAAGRGPLHPPAEVAPLDPTWPPPRDVPAGRVGLLVGVDETACRHVYGVGTVPPGRYAGELGALLAEPPPDGVELRLDARGRPLLDEEGTSPLSAAR